MDNNPNDNECFSRGGNLLEKALKGKREMKQQCYRCRFEKEMDSHNFWFTVGGGQFYLCDECRLTEMIRKITNSLELCSHLLDIEKIEQILKIVAKQKG